MLKKTTNLKVCHHQFIHVLGLSAERIQILVSKHHSPIKESVLPGETVDSRPGTAKTHRSLERPVMPKRMEVFERTLETTPTGRSSQKSEPEQFEQ